MALHYWRPDYSPDQAKILMEDYIHDLEAYTPVEIERACMEYRRTPGNEFFPKVCQLLEILNPPKAAWENRGPRLRAYRSSDYLLEGPRAMRTISQILRHAGFGRAAEDWDTWKESRPQAKPANGGRA
jgi:hypothetical protein